MSYLVNETQNIQHHHKHSQNSPQIYGVLETFKLLKLNSKLASYLLSIGTLVTRFHTLLISSCHIYHHYSFTNLNYPHQGITLYTNQPVVLALYRTSVLASSHCCAYHLYTLIYFTIGNIHLINQIQCILQLRLEGARLGESCTNVLLENAVCF